MSVLRITLAAFAAVFPIRVACAADGPTVYRENCAACHGKQGHGDGETAPTLKYKPRDFREGKFAFGNTPGAMVKTVMSGIPGEEQARMPAFKSVLSAEEIDAVVSYVRTMMPVEPAPTPTDMKLEPRDGALMVRGILPGLKEGDPPIARGLLFGLPSGFSFEYGTEDVRLLAVRRGEFVSRTDWEERGGRPLTPLGTLAFATAQAKGWSEFKLVTKGDAEAAPIALLNARLRSTSVRGGVAELLYDLVDGDGQTLARVRERPRDVAVSDGAGILQELEITAPKSVDLMFAALLASDPKLPLPKASEAEIKSSTDVTKHHFEQKALAQATGWYLVQSGKAASIAVRFELPDGGRVTNRGGDDHDAIGATFSIGPKPVTLKRIIIARGETTLEQLEKMTAETKELR